MDKLNVLNQFTRREHTAEEVYLFDVCLCDNEIDRDLERFSIPALEELKNLFVGKTGIFDHNPKGSNQTARIFETELVTDPTRKTSIGEPYTYVKGSAYMVRTDANHDLIREIDAGIKKEVSISCRADSHICSVCGKDIHQSHCIHAKGKMYKNNMAHVILSDIKDAYEWSFVAVPAQRQAGVTKHFTNGFNNDEYDDNEEIKSLKLKLEEQSEIIKQIENETRKEITQLCFLNNSDVQKSISQASEFMSLPALISLKNTLKSEQKKCGVSQLALEKDIDMQQLDDFRM